MIKKISSLIVTAILFLTSCTPELPESSVVDSPPSDTKPEKGLSLSLSVEKTKYKVGENIIVKLTLKNNSESEILLKHYHPGINGTGERSNVSFEIIQNQVQVKYIHEERLKKMNSDWQRYKFKVGEQLQFYATLNEWYDMSKPAIYKIVATYAEEGINIKSNQIDLNLIK
jgi:hypothetical protein